MIHETKYRKQAYSTWEKEKEDVLKEWRHTVQKVAHRLRQKRKSETSPPELKKTFQENH